MDFPDLGNIEGENDLWGWMQAHQLNFTPEHPSPFISDKFEIAKVPFLPTPPQTPISSITTTNLIQTPPVVTTSVPIEPTRTKSSSDVSISNLKIKAEQSETPTPAISILPSVITSTSSSSATEKWVTLETPKNLIQKKQFNEKCLEMLTDVGAFSHSDPPVDLISSTVKGRKNGAFKYLEADSVHPKESWKRDGFTWNQKGGWHVIYENKLKRKTFTLQGDKSFKKSVTKLAITAPQHDAVVVTYFFHPSENKEKKRKKEEISAEESPVETCSPKKSSSQFPATVLQVCSCSHHNPQEEIIEQEKLLRQQIFGTLTENNSLTFDEFVVSLVKHSSNLTQLMRSRNPNAYDIPTKHQKIGLLTKEECKSVMGRFLGKTVTCIDFQRFFFQFGPFSSLMMKLKDVYNLFQIRKDVAEKGIIGKDKGRVVYPAPEPMCLVLAVYCTSEQRIKNYLLKNGDTGIQFQVSRSLWSTCFSTVTELLQANAALF